MASRSSLRKNLDIVIVSADPAMCVALGEPGCAARIFAVAAAIRKTPLLIHVSIVDEDIIATARRALGDEEFAIAWTEGQSMTVEELMTQIVDPARDYGKDGAEQAV
jgi:hypothetical protein